MPGPTSRTVPEARARRGGIRSEERMIWSGGWVGGGDAGAFAWRYAEES